MSTSEDEYGIPKQPPDTCPMIDEIYHEIKYVCAHSADYRKIEDIEEVRNIAAEFEDTLDSIDLEKIRTNAEKLREWGQAWKDFAKERVREIEDLESKLAEKNP